ncbi:MAG: hypothetical protein OEV76_10200 [Anaerolineae bacterium]|nr:hypothetical protein [Anaerolineae bacterium]
MELDKAVNWKSHGGTTALLDCRWTYTPDVQVPAGDSPAELA